MRYTWIKDGMASKKSGIFVEKEKAGTNAVPDSHRPAQNIVPGPKTAVVSDGGVGAREHSVASLAFGSHPAAKASDGHSGNWDQEFLFAVAEMIRKSPQAEELIRTIPRLVGEYLNVHRCLFNEIDLDTDTETVRFDHSRTGETVAGTYRISDYSSVMSGLMSSGKTVVNHDSMLDPRTTDLYEKTYGPSGERSYVAVPMMRNGRWVASLWCSDDKPRDWTGPEVALIENIAERSWAAVERLRHEEALRASEERFELAQAAGNVGIWDWDISADRTYWSDTMWRFYGEQPSSVNPDDRFWSAHLHPDDRARVVKNLDRTIKSFDLTYRDEFRIIGADSRIIWIASRANITREPDGKAVRAYGVNVDITERKLNEERIKRNERQLRLVTDSVPALIAYVDDLQRYQFVNQTYSDWFGSDASEFIGKPVKDTVGKQAYTFLSPLIDRALKGETISVNAQLAYDLAGVRSVQINYVPDVADDGTVKGFFSLVSDLTDAKRAEELLRSSEERIALLMENVTDYAIFSMNTDGIIESWNTGAERIFGYTFEEIVGNSGEILFTREDVSRGIPQNEMRSARQKGRATDERWYLRKDGSRFFASGVMMPLIVGKRLTGYAKIASDLTEKKRRAEQLQAAHDDLELRVFQRTKELAEANELLRREVHERKLSERQRVRLLYRIVSAQEEERKRIARDLHDQLGQRLTALRLKLASLHDLTTEKPITARVERLQEIAKMLDAEVSFLASELRPTILDDLGLEEALRAFVNDWSRHFDIEIEFHSNGVNGRRYGRETETQIYRIVQEALTNVAKHSGAGNASVLMEQNGQFLVLIVEDNGSGFEQEKQRRKRAKGLGLIGMRERATLIGAELEIETTPGSGTSVFVRLPNRKRGRTNAGKA
ncbi:MAG: PAS domain S-box protein [Acidobacteria bacterium]|nr:PAS domain S-box protein [Acidobacteriota bacterium]